MRVAWMMSVFPRLTETFVLYEILAAERRGLEIDVYPLRGSDGGGLVHPEAKQLSARVRYLPFVSLAVLRSQLSWLRRSPRRYLSTLWDVLRWTFGSANYFFGALALYPKVAHAGTLMVRDGVEHLHCHFANHPALGGFIISRLTGIPFSFTAHAHDLYVDQHMLAQKVQEARFVVAISNYNRDRILECAAPAAADKVLVIHCGVDTDVFAPPKPMVLRPSFEIICVARGVQSKGLDYLIGACRILAERGLHYRCRIVGASSASLQRMVGRAGLTDRVKLAGWRTRPELVRFLRESDVLVSSSVPTPSGRQEGIPVVLMEAMAIGLPVVATCVSGVPELVIDGHTGLLVPPADAGALADALERLHSEPELRSRLGDAARIHVLANFNLQVNVTKLLALIEGAS